MIMFYMILPLIVAFLVILLYKVHTIEIEYKPTDEDSKAD